MRRRALLVLAGFVPLVLAPAPEQDPDEKLQGVVNRLAGKAETLTGIKFKEEIPAAFQSRNDFEETLEKSVKVGDPQQTVAPATLAYQLLGLLPPNVSPAEKSKEMMRTQTGAYYDPKKKKLFIVRGRMTPETLAALIFHELIHGMQDQQHDLVAIRDSLRKAKNHDGVLAFNFLVEGEASFWTHVYQLSLLGENFMKMPPAAQRMAFSTSKALSSSGVVNYLTQGANTPELRKAAEEMRKVPPILIRKHNDPYLRGRYACYRVWEQEGAKGLRALFRKPPPCTRDMMFADEWVKSPRTTAKIRLASLQDVLGKDWKNTFEDTGGSITWHTMFEEEKRVADDIAEGWDGDRLQVWQTDKAALLAGVVAFNSKRTASTFERNFEQLFRDVWKKGQETKKHSCKAKHWIAGTDHFVLKKKGQIAAFARGAVPEDCKGLMETLLSSGVEEAEKIDK